MNVPLQFLALGRRETYSFSRWIKVVVWTILWTIPGSVISLVIIAIQSPEGQTMNEVLASIKPSALGVAVLVLPFATAFYGLCRQVQRQHGRDWKTLITVYENIAWNKVMLGALVWGGIFIVDVAIQYISSPQRFTWAFNPSEWLLLLVVAVLLIPIQSGFEELFFRGYLMQTSAIVCKRAWQPLVITSVVFGLLHNTNPEVQAYGFVMMIAYIGMGLMLGVAVIMDDSIELAIGAHAANNILSALLVTETNSVLQTPSLFRMSGQQPDALWLFLETAITAVAFLLILHSVCRWESWKRLLLPIWSTSDSDTNDLANIKEQVV
ncbi:MAG: CPBP family intramembrane glutamic endopeptidase [Bacteroidota bacterium]|nr:CPBP family intramembrane metalloprotease [Candidatus Kapabacteria bacterium]MDW8221040.1 CPBP family intramembrane glutamic endopeptidase [Bacteroidota bacterium]